MTDLRDRFSWLDGVAVPDVWEDVERRGPQPPMQFPPPTSRRVAAIAVATVVTLVAGAVLLRSLPGTTPAATVDEGAIVYRASTPDTSSIQAVGESGPTTIVPTGEMADLLWLTEPVVSPDGRWLAAGSVFRDDASRPVGVVVIPSSGGGPLVFPDAANTVQKANFGGVGSPAWSPDGVEIAFDAVDHGVWSGLALNTTSHREAVLSLRQLVSPEDPRFGPGTISAGEPTWSSVDPAIAVSVAIDPAAPDAGPAQIWIVSTLEDGGVMQLTREPAGAWDPDWSPDGLSIAFVSGDEIRIMPCDGSTPSEVLVTGFDEIASPSWSPSGDSLVFAAREDGGRWDLYVTDLEGHVTQLTATPDTDESDPSWGAALAG